MAITFTTTSGSTTVTVNDTAHGALTGDRVIFEDVSGLSSALNSALAAEFEVQSAATNTYTITLSSAADQTNSSAGQASAFYLLETGLNTTVLGSGWGAGTWGRFTWGSAAGNLAGQTLRLWFADNFGEDLIINVADGRVYYWDATGGLTNNRAIPLENLSGASNTPTVARKILVSEVDRHVLAFGANPLGSTEQDPLLIRFSNQEDAANWTPTATNTAGDIRLSQGSEIITALRTRREILVWTDTSLNSVQFTGAPFTFGTALLADNVRIASPNAAVSVNDVVFWMGQENFYVYDGRVQALPCSVRDYVFSDLNRNQAFKIHAGSLASETEIWWFYPTQTNNASGEVNRYVVYNYGEKVWYYGQLSRTAWNDRGAGQRSYPQAVEGGYLYNHEFGLNDDGSAINAFVQSSDFDIGDGEQFMFLRRVIPDITFNDSDTSTPAATLSIQSRDFPGKAITETVSGVVTESSTDVYTNQIFTRARGRSLNFKVSSNAVDVKWRLGAPRIDVRADGRR